MPTLPTLLGECVAAIAFVIVLAHWFWPAEEPVMEDLDQDGDQTWWKYRLPIHAERTQTDNASAVARR